MGADSRVGKIYDGGSCVVRREEIEAYASATDDPNPAYRGAGALSPPMFHVRLMWPLLEALAADPELELDRRYLVHGEHAMSFLSPLRDGDPLSLSAKLASLEDKPSGRVVVFSLNGARPSGEIALQGSTTYFIRAPAKGDAPKAPRAQPPEPPPPDLVVEQGVPLDMPARYAQASGDHNPIHLDEAFARSAGLPGVILHGLCTMALAQRDIIASCCGGDPRSLRSLSVRFAKPVRPGSKLRLELRRSGGDIEFLTRNEAGDVVITNGRAAVAVG